MLFTVTQFHISKTWNGDVSAEICEFLEECYCWITISEIGRNISWKICIKIIKNSKFVLFIY